jgi:CBS domain-containing protein
VNQCQEKRLHLKLISSGVLKANFNVGEWAAELSGLQPSNLSGRLCRGLEENMPKCKELMDVVKRVVVPTDTVFAAAQIMKNHSVSAVPVVASKQSRKLIGLVAERDVVVRVIGEALTSQTTVGDIMTPQVATCSPEEDIENALKLMDDLQIRHVPVVDENGDLLGIIHREVAA